MQYQNENDNSNPVIFSIYNPPADDVYNAALAYTEKNMPVIVAEMKAMRPAAALVYGAFKMNEEQDTTGSRGWLVTCVTRYNPHFQSDSPQGE